jgi:hypothetical protein
VVPKYNVIVQSFALPALDALTPAFGLTLFDENDAVCLTNIEDVLTYDQRLNLFYTVTASDAATAGQAALEQVDRVCKSSKDWLLEVGLVADADAENEEAEVFDVNDFFNTPLSEQSDDEVEAAT